MRDPCTSKGGRRGSVLRAIALVVLIATPLPLMAIHRAPLGGLATVTVADQVAPGAFAGPARDPDANGSPSTLYYQWVGAATNPSLPGSATGIGSTVDYRPSRVPCPAPGYATFLRSSVEAATAGNVAVNLGFFLLNSSLGGTSCQGSGPFPYYRNASGNFEVVCGFGALADGPHTFNATASATGTNWTFAVDGAPMAGATFDWGNGRCDGPSVTGTLDLGDPAVGLPSLWSAIKEESTSPNQVFWSIPDFSLPMAFSYRIGNAWAADPVGVTTRVSTTGTPPIFGVEGEKQDPTLGPGEIIVGNGVPWPTNTSVLWAPPLGVGIALRPSSGIAPLRVDATASVSGGTGTYSSETWSFGDGTQAVGVGATHTFLWAGTYHVTLAVADSAGESVTSAAYTVTVTASSPTTVAEWALGIGAAVAIALVGLVLVRRARRGRRTRPGGEGSDAPSPPVSPEGEPSSAGRLPGNR